MKAARKKRIKDKYGDCDTADGACLTPPEPLPPSRLTQPSPIPPLRRIDRERTQSVWEILKHVDPAFLPLWAKTAGDEWERVLDQSPASFGWLCSLLADKKRVGAAGCSMIGVKASTSSGQELRETQGMREALAKLIADDKSFDHWRRPPPSPFPPPAAHTRTHPSPFTPAPVATPHIRPPRCEGASTTSSARSS